MKIYTLRLNYEGILMDMFYGDLSKTINVIVLAYGMPGTPVPKETAFVNKAVESGFAVVCPNYIGTFDSYGKFDIENSVLTLTKTAEFIVAGKGKNLMKDTMAEWKVNKISLLGWSFGGSAALVAGAKSKYVSKIIAVSAPTDYKTHRKGYDEESLDGLSKIMTMLYPNTWRIESQAVWSKFIKGELDLNAVDYIEQLGKKEILLIHGMEDKAVSYKRAELFYKKLDKGQAEKEIMLLKDKGHLDIRYLDNDQIFNKIVSFARK